jgi:hypothetical protein
VTESSADSRLQHIDDDSLELYALGRLSEFEVFAIQEHLLICTACRTHYDEILEFASTMHAAAWQIVTELIATHHTEDGLIYLYVRPSDSDTWVATIRGESTSGGVTAPTRQGAVSECVEAFRQMFPEHMCTAACSVDAE